MKRMFQLLLVASVFAAVGCGDPVPVQEMASAKSSVSKASAVKAEKYAPEEYKAAVDMLLESHTLVSEEKWDDAAKKAVAAEAKAKEAYDKAAPLLAKDSIEVAEASIKASDDAFASELAKEEFGDANAKLKKAQENFDAKQYEQAYQSALEADIAAKNARNVAISRKGMLGDAITEVKATLREAKKYNAETLAKEKYDAAVENLGLAEKSYDDASLKQGFAYADTAKVNADEAYQIALKETALDRITQAKESYALAAGSKGASDSPADLKASKELLDRSEKQYNDGLYIDAIDTAGESIRLSGLVTESSKEAAARDASTTVTTTTDTTTTDTTTSTEPEPEKDYIIYRVRWYEAAQKDCLWLIAQKFYKNPRKWKIIYEANRDIIKNPNWIFPGWRLKIPKQ